MNKIEGRVGHLRKDRMGLALKAKITTLITGLSGFYMLYVLDACGRYLQLKFWWIHAMTLNQ